MAKSVALIGAPTSAGAYAPGQEDGPDAVRAAGLLSELERRGVEVVDLGDIPRWRWRPDPSSPRAMNVDGVAAGIRAVAGKVADALERGHFPLVVGGDCTIELGTVAGAREQLESFGLVYFDSHPDLNVPDAVPDGALDWMGVAHLLGVDGAVPELARIGDRSPLLEPADLLLFATSPARSTEHELAVIDRLGIETVDVGRVATDPTRVAADAVGAFAADRPYLLHFDVDVVDFGELPLAENTDKNVGLGLDAATAALDGLLGGGEVAAVTVTELNPHHGAADGSTARRFVERLAVSLAQARPLT